MRLPLVAIAALIIGGTESNPPRPMSFLDLLNIPALSDPQLSPDGSLVAYVQDAPDWKENKRIGHIWRVPVSGGAPVQLTRGTRGESSPRWSPDGKTLAFLARREGQDDAQIHLLDGRGGEARALSAHVTAVSAIEWSPDGARIYFLAEEAKSVEERAAASAKADVFQYDENFKQRHSWYIAVPGGQETRVTNGEFSVMSYRLSRDGRQIVAQRAPTPLLGDAEQGEVWITDAEGRDPRRLTTNGVAEQQASLSPDGRQVLFVASASPRFETYYQAAAFVMPAAGGPARPVAPDFPFEVESARWADAGTVVATVNTGVRSELFAFALDQSSRPRQLTTGDHALNDWSYSASARRHIFLLDAAAHPGEVWTLAADPDARPTQVTSVFGDLPKQFAIARQERAEWTAPDGQSIDGVVFYPADYVAGRKYPLVVQTHGGPASSDKFGWGSRMSYAQVLTGKGFVVLRPNYRGSTGYGNAFLRDMIGGYFRHAHLDVMAGVDALVARGIADPDRLVAMGWSAGGHMTNKLITFTDRFKAASSGAGAANWVSMYAQSDIRSYRTPWFGGSPWQARAPIDLYWEQSPLKYVAQVRTPTIFFVGQDDPRVPLPQSVEMYRAVKSLGVPTHLYVAPREGHGWQELRHQVAKFNAEMAWFEKYARNATFSPETPPETAKADLPRP
jgi:dipeptidyl aminopeptidase/acylaminoacyl peptidase